MDASVSLRLDPACARDDEQHSRGTPGRPLLSPPPMRKRPSRGRGSRRPLLVLSDSASQFLRTVAWLRKAAVTGIYERILGAGLHARAEARPSCGILAGVMSKESMPPELVEHARQLAERHDPVVDESLRRRSR
jgi:hypothetical protein